LLEDKPAEETPETQEGEFSCSAEEISEAQHNDLDIYSPSDYTNEGWEISTHG